MYLLLLTTSYNICIVHSNYLQNEKKTSPFLTLPCQKLMDKIKKWASENNYSLDEYDRKKRLPVTKTLHGAGIVVPFNKKTELGYRPLVESNGKNMKFSCSNGQHFRQILFNVLSTYNTVKEIL